MVKLVNDTVDMLFSLQFGCQRGCIALLVAKSTEHYPCTGSVKQTTVQRTFCFVRCSIFNELTCSISMILLVPVLKLELEPLFPLCLPPLVCNLGVKFQCESQL